MRRQTMCLVFVCLAACAAAAQTIDVERLIAADPAMDRDTLFRLQLLAGRPAEALQTLRALPPSAANVRWEIYAKAKSSDKPFDEAFKQAFRETMQTIDDKTAHRVLYTFGTSLTVLQRALDDARAKNTDAIDLARKTLSVEAYRSFSPLLAELADEDDRRRYAIEKDVRVRMPDGGSVCALIIRPRGDRRLPTLFNFTIYADAHLNYDEARRNASNGYVAVLGLIRGKGCSPGSPVPYEHDSADAAAVIDWIAAQPWSDGRVGMYGGSYEGGTTWGAAKRMPKALKGIMTGAPVAPGLDVPMEGNVFWNFVYPYPFYTTNNKMLDNATYNDSARWTRLDRESYTSGRAYRDLEKIDGTPNPIFNRWLAHPAYDAYWQSMIPYGKEFARIHIPVLTTAGYYYGGPGAAVYYVQQHTKHRPNAEHYLVIGPYDHVRGHSGTVSLMGTKSFTQIAGYELEPAAHLDMGELRYRWFDYVFGRGAKPELLKDRVNYFVVGANQWKHAPSIAAMSPRTMKLRLEGTLTVNLADRSDVDREVPGGGVIDKVIDTANGVRFVSDSIPGPAEISGLYSGHLEFITNKKDFDFNIALYEWTASGEYVQLAPYWARASYAGHPGERRLLTPGKRQRLDFESIRLTSRKLQPGSRIVAVLSVIKELGRQLNYGTGRDVSTETIADAKEPLVIQWLAGSYLDLPVTP